MAGNDQYTKLLLHLDNNVTDDSASSHSVTNNNVTFSSGTKKFGTHSASFNGSTADLVLSDSADWHFGSGNFTVDLWFYPTDLSSIENIIGQWPGASNRGWRIYNSAASKIWFSYSTDGTTNTEFNIENSDINMNDWNHLAWVRDGSTMRVFVDGTQITTHNCGSDSLNNSTADLYVGSLENANYFNGYMDEIRISKGIARWTSNFTPPTEPYCEDKLIDYYRVRRCFPIDRIPRSVLVW